MAGITSGAKLLKALKDTGTGIVKLQAGYALLESEKAANGGKATDVDADRMAKALLADCANEITRQKIDALLTDGVWHGPPTPVSVLDEVLGVKPEPPKPFAGPTPNDQLQLMREEIQIMRAKHEQELREQAEALARQQTAMADLKAELELAREQATVTA